VVTLTQEEVVRGCEVSMVIYDSNPGLLYRASLVKLQQTQVSCDLQVQCGCGLSWDV